ncbi:uncharacterized protein LOC135088144 [Ostrinia nubilalis]|uniref:uncharacterized protein LOC135088144 n=1 Tax=Ostrinia nubilalis TaxID=29057 RepID=UPI003082560B
MLCSVALLAIALCASAQGRAVNISNTWVLPEEGFPVFYRYFRDRISWYEADAVCQFHHANLVTVDTTAQYDAVRAYLKELDISSAVWVGLIRSNPDGDFTWTDYRGLGGDGYWSSAPDPRAAPLCAAADPAADYRWEARACGGPTVASFICELPVPQWALGNEGCMVKALPALTVLYLPESAAVQLNADCGLAGVKRVQCTGNVKREDLLRDLSCAEEDEPSSTVGLVPTGATSTVTSENLFTDQDLNEATTEENTTTEHEDDINQSSTIKPTLLTFNNPSLVDQSKQEKINKNNHIYIQKNINLDATFRDNMLSNDIPKLGSDNSLSSDIEKLEDDKHLQHKLLHDEFARHGNFETIFTQPTDHFVPPLVMAKAKISDDMTVLSLEEKHAQQLAEQRYSKHLHPQVLASEVEPTESKVIVNKLKIDDVTDKPLITTAYSSTLKEEVKQNLVKTIIPKKYNDKYYGLKVKNLKAMETKPSKTEKIADTNSTLTTESRPKDDEVRTKYTTSAYSDDKSEEEPTIDLTVIIKEPELKNNGNFNNHSSEIPKIEIIQNDSSVSEPEVKLTNPENSEGQIEQEISVKIPTKSGHNVTLTHEVIKITIVKEENSSEVPLVFEVTTKVPVFEDDNAETSTPTIKSSPKENQTPTSSPITADISSTKLTPETTADSVVTTPLRDLVLSTFKPTPGNVLNDKLTIKTDFSTTSVSPIHITTMTNENITADIGRSNETEFELTSTSIPSIKDIDETETEPEDMLETNTTDTSQTIDDFQSPLLSAANEPIHRPSRSRRPQTPPNRNKFNPFRILG